MGFLALFLLLFPVAGAALAWGLLRGRSLPLAWFVGVLAGNAPILLLAGAVHRGEGGTAGGGADSGPLLFLGVSIGVGVLVALATLATLQFASRARG